MNNKNWVTDLIKELLLFFRDIGKIPVTTPIPPPEPQKDPPPQDQPKPIQITQQEKIYMAAKLCLGKHITLNENVPHDVGCAEAISYVLKAAGYTLPKQGFAGTSDLRDWLMVNMLKTLTPSPGAIIISATGLSTIKAPHGHVGACGKFGIMSNNSDTGLFTELWTLPKWQEYYHDKLGFPVEYFIPSKMS